MESYSALNAAAVLDQQDLHAAMKRIKPVVNYLRSAPGPLRELVLGRVTEALHEQLAVIDLGEVAVGAWSRIQELHAAAERTLANPAAREDVSLIDHEVTSEHQLAIELWLDGHLLVALTVDLVFTLIIVGITAVVRRGRLVQLRSGEVRASGRLRWHDHDLATSPPLTASAGSVVQLGAGVPLVHQGATPTLR